MTAKTPVPQTKVTPTAPASAQKADASATSPAEPPKPTEAPALTPAEAKDLKTLEELGKVPTAEKGKPFYPLGAGSEPVLPQTDNPPQ